MPVTKRTRSFRFLAAATATAASALFYWFARSKLMLLRDLNEVTPDEMRHAVNATRLWLVIGCVMALVTVCVALLPNSEDQEKG